MSEKFEKIVSEILQNHRGKFFGLLAGFIFGFMVISLGFLKTLFLTFCLYIGYIIGKRIDDNESLREVVERIFKGR